MRLRRRATRGDASLLSLMFRAMSILTAAMLLASTGCEKVPTFQELTQQGQTTPAASTPAAKPAAEVVAQPAAVVQVAPELENPQKIIGDFKNTPAGLRNDADLARLAKVAVGSSELTIMDLNGSAVTDDGLKNLAKLPQIESLSLVGTKVTDVGLTVTTQLPELRSLNLGAFAVNASMMATLSKLEKLEVLGLEGAKVTDNDLPPLENLAELKELNLSATPITDNAFKILGRLKKLEILKVAYTSINGSGMQYMKRKKSEVGLRVLDAKKTRFGEQGLQYIKGVETLEELDLGQAEVTDRTLFQNMKGVNHLKVLNLSFNILTDNGTLPLGNIKSLEKLYLRNCQGIGDKTLGFLKSSKELKILDVNGCSGVTDKSAQQLKKLLPNCEIQYNGRTL